MDLRRLPQLNGWLSDSEVFDPKTFMLANVTVGEVAVISSFFWPEFAEYRGCVFLGFVFDSATIDLWYNRFRGDTEAIEAMVNHIHLWDYLAPKNDAERTALSEVAVRVSQMWRAALRAAFPGREFSISVTDDPDDYGPTVSFHSVNAGPPV